MFRKLLAAAVAGLAVLTPAVPAAAAATTPTLAGPAERTGYGTITLTGTAAPGAAVHLYESAVWFRDLQPADDWEHGGGTVTARADAHGKFHIVRYLDTGFYFQVESGGVRSARVTVHMRVRPTMWLESRAAGTVRAHIEASPNEEGLPVKLQRASGTAWVTVASGRTNEVGALIARAGHEPSGTHTYRTYIGADPANGMLANYSTTRKITIKS